MLKTLIALCSIFALSTAEAQADVFLQAISFAITGSDSTKINVINRKDCIFGIGKDIIHLNNIHVERISITEWVEKNQIYGERRYVTVDIRGEEPVYEEFKAGLTKNQATEEMVRELQKTDPRASNLFKSRMVKHSEYRLTLNTNEKERVVRAWSYIYQNGCTGKKSPF